MRLFRELTGAVQRAAQAVETLTSATEALREVQGDGDVHQRLKDMELNLEKWEAGIEALVLRAEGKFRAARASEERARKRHGGILEDDTNGEVGAGGGTPARAMDGEDASGTDGGDYAQALPGEGMQTVPEVLGPGRAAINAKFGIR